MRAIGAIPNEYLHYYYFNRDAVAALRSSSRGRADLVLDQQRDFYARTADSPDSAFEAWEATRREREVTYMAENREAAGAGERESCDMDSGGYENVALAVMRAIAQGERTTLILNVRNRGALAGLDDDAVVEVPCVVDGNGARPLTTDPLPDHAMGLVVSVKAVERAVLEAATTGSRAAALRALAIHPLVDSVTVARRLLERYETDHPQLGYLREKAGP